MPPIRDDEDFQRRRLERQALLKELETQTTPTTAEAPAATAAPTTPTPTTSYDEPPGSPSRSSQRVGTPGYEAPEQQGSQRDTELYPPTDTTRTTPETPSESSSVFQSENMDWRGYLKEATRAYAPTLQGIKDEAAREKAVEDYIRSLIPEIQRRGGQISDVRKEKIQTADGKWIDLYRDITDGTGSGAAEAQWLEEDGTPAARPTAATPAAGAAVVRPGVDVPDLTTTPTGNPQDDFFGRRRRMRLQALLQGEDAVSREALLQMMEQGQ